jgi:hypothetical protein
VVQAGPNNSVPARGPGKSGWDEVSRTFRWVSSRFSNGTPGSVEIVAAGGKVSSSTVTMLFLVLPSCIPGASSDTLE